MSWEKTSLFTTRFQLLGYSITEDGVELLDERIAGFKEWPRPLLDPAHQPANEERTKEWFDADAPTTCQGCAVDIKGIRSFLG